MEQQHIVNRVLNANITQERLGNYLEITRQTVAKLSRGEYVKLSSTCQKRLLAFDNKSDEDIRHMIALTEYMKSIQTQIMTGDSDYVKKAHEGFKYMHYWMRDDKFNKQAKYHIYYFGHMNNFYPRFNQAALFMRDTLDRQKYPLLTYQIDYQNK